VIKYREEYDILSKELGIQIRILHRIVNGEADLSSKKFNRYCKKIKKKYNQEVNTEEELKDFIKNFIQNLKRGYIQNE
jgi:hypothetical protein